MSLAHQLDYLPDEAPSVAWNDLQPAEATVLIWVDRVTPARPFQCTVGSAPPSVVLHPGHADRERGLIDLADFGCAYRATAIAFSPGDEFSSITLCDTVNGRQESRYAEYQIRRRGYLNLYTVGWAARTAAVTFNR
jgi:hypothetical protein